jgi:hypothetical protein
MGDSPAHLDGGGDTERGRDRESSIGMPRWVKVFLIITLALVLTLRGRETHRRGWGARPWPPRRR